MAEQLPTQPRRKPITKRSLADDLKYQLKSHRVKFEGEWVLLTPDEARAILALVEAAEEFRGLLSQKLASGAYDDEAGLLEMVNSVEGLNFDSALEALNRG